MVEFRKAFLLLAGLVVAAGLVSAQSSLVCNATAGNPPPARAEGVAEEVGQVLIICTGGTSADSPEDILPTINVQIFLDTNVTSRLLGTAGSNTEALLLIDEPVGLEQVEAASSPFTGTVNASGNGTYKTTGVAGRPTVFGSQLSSANSLTWLNIPFDPPGTQASRTLRIVNVRANASSINVSEAFFGPIRMFISISGAVLTLNNSQLVVAYVQSGMDFTSDKALSFNQCSPGTTHFVAKFTEKFGTAFRRNIVTGEAQNDYNVNYGTESMFYNPAFAGIAAGAGMATQGTQLIMRFKDIPTGVTITVPTTLSNTAPLADSAILVATSASTTNITTGVVTITGGAGAAVWEVMSSSSGSIRSLDVDVAVTLKADPLPGLTDTASISGNYSPIATSFTASRTDNRAPRFVEAPKNANIFRIISCRTNLLFPFVTADAGFDTGIAISNTTKDPFGTAAQAGACFIYYYGSNQPPVNPAVSSTIPAGEQLVFLTSSGNSARLVGAAAAFQGYIIATCNFQYAHGYAFISTRDQGGLAQGYLALVMDDSIGASRTLSASEPLNN